MKKIFSLLFLLLFIPTIAFSAEHTADSCSIAHINTKLALASSGDTVNVPAGDCSWAIDAATYITIPEGVKLIGAGSAADGTNITISSYTQPAWNHYGLKLVGSNVLSGMSFNGNSVTGLLIIIYGTSNRITATKHEGFTGRSIIVNDVDVNNLIDNNSFYGTGPDIGGGSIQAQWTEATDLGSENFTFVENNRFSDISVSTVQRPVEIGYSHRVVMRHNDIYYEATGDDDHGCFANTFADVHGYCHASTAPGRAGRAYEIYNNKVFVTDAPSAVADAVYIRGGTGVIYKNYIYFKTSEMYRSGKAVSIWNHRSNNSGSGDGQDSCYAVDRNPTGAHFCWDDAYTLGVSSETFYYSGVLTGDTSGASATILGGTTTGSPLYFRNPTGTFQNGEGLKRNGVSIGTATTAMTAYAGEGYPCQDQPGSGLNQSTTREPIYVWGNVDRDGNTLGAAESSSPTNVTGYFTENVDYFNSAKTGYTAYTCPHPLATELSGKYCDDTQYGTAGYGLDSDNALTVTKAGSGTGRVTSSPSGINCGATCEFSYESGTVTLTATATSPSYFVGWSGEGCSGTSTCEVTMSAARGVTATFSRYGVGTIGAGGQITFGSGGSMTLQ